MNWTQIITIALIVVASLSILFYFIQDKLIFKPEKLSKDFVFQYENQVVEEYNFELRDGVLIRFSCMTCI